MAEREQVIVQKDHRRSCYQDCEKPLVGKPFLKPVAGQDKTSQDQAAHHDQAFNQCKCHQVTKDPKYFTERMVQPQRR